MKLKRKSGVMENFSMASMTDVIFLLLIFFMVTSTLVVPSALKVTLPQSKEQTQAKPVTRITLDKDLRYFIGVGKESDREVLFEEIAPILASTTAQNPDMYVALYADESVPYKEVVRVLNIAVENNYKMVLATRPLTDKAQ
ncbi:MAG: biopolymer transporter ExbD [Porphyromonas sp.]|nr:biopolymer transporter ExbD [Bacteroidales bacterium]MDY3101266.1 biopolymer transporter ExbD [Porphyromonas sp.]